jgi:methylenetetrahydrofolate dehydrogenase (NADP+)/methenyltetrahydrofolate cyclohydrolase
MGVSMTAQLLDGKTVAQQLKNTIAESIQKRQAARLSTPTLAVVLVGNDPASQIYVNAKRRTCADLSIKSEAYDLSENTPEETLLSLIDKLNLDPSIHGILVQLPLPVHIESRRIIEAIHPHKDVDGFHPYNLGRLAQRAPALRPCTPYGVITLLNHYQLPIKGKHAVVVGASNIVGRPMALELLIAGATVTVCHRFTEDLSKYVHQADILISAVGKPHLIKAEWLQNNAVVVDVGINRLSDGTLAGDIEFEAAKAKASWITPVPGGVGPMTVAMLMQNTVEAAMQQDV